MGFYIETGTNHGKANLIVERYKAEIVDLARAFASFEDPTKGAVVVVDNGPFEAAAFAFDENEFVYFARNIRGDDEKKEYTDSLGRRMQFLVGNRVTLAEAAGYRGR